MSIISSVLHFEHAVGRASGVALESKAGDCRTISVEGPVGVDRVRTRFGLVVWVQIKVTFETLSPSARERRRGVTYQVGVPRSTVGRRYTPSVHTTIPRRTATRITDGHWLRSASKSFLLASSCDFDCRVGAVLGPSSHVAARDF